MNFHFQFSEDTIQVFCCLTNQDGVIFFVIHCKHEFSLYLDIKIECFLKIHGKILNIFFRDCGTGLRN